MRKLPTVILAAIGLAVSVDALAQPLEIIPIGVQYLHRERWTYQAIIIDSDQRVIHQCSVDVFSGEAHHGEATPNGCQRIATASSFDNQNGVRSYDGEPPIAKKIGYDALWQTNALKQVQFCFLYANPGYKCVRVKLD